MKIIATDLDGTLFKGETLINGVKESILELRNNNIEIYFTTNNSSQSPSVIREKLFSLLNLEIDVNKIKNLNEREKELRDKAKKIIEEVSNNSLKRIESNDKDYVFISFILKN